MTEELPGATRSQTNKVPLMAVQKRAGLGTPPVCFAKITKSGAGIRNMIADYQKNQAYIFQIVPKTLDIPQTCGIIKTVERHRT